MITIEDILEEDTTILVDGCVLQRNSDDKENLLDYLYNCNDFKSLDPDLLKECQDMTERGYKIMTNGNVYSIPHVSNEMYVFQKHLSENIAHLKIRKKGAMNHNHRINEDNNNEQMLENVHEISFLIYRQLKGREIRLPKQSEYLTEMIKTIDSSIGLKKSGCKIYKDGNMRFKDDSDTDERLVTTLYGNVCSLKRLLLF